MRITISLENSKVTIEENNVEFKITKKSKDGSLSFHGVSNWDKGFRYEEKREALKLELVYNGEIIGQVGLDYGKRYGKRDYIFAVSIKPSFQHNGYGSKIMHEIEKYVEDDKVYLRPRNKKVAEFYKKLGYKKSEPDKYGPIMYKKLK